MNTKRPSGKKLKEIINATPLCILYAHLGGISKFNNYLKQQVKEKYTNQVTIASIDLTKINYANSEILEFVRSWIPSIGLQRTSTIFPGYYLFRNVILIGYHSGTIDPGNLNAKSEGILTIINAVAGTIVGIIEKNASKEVETFVEGMNIINGARIFNYFQRVLVSKGWKEYRTKSQNVSDTPLIKAYKLLKVPSNATDLEITKAWRKMVNQYHPDKNVDEKEKESRTRITTEINQAYMLIKSERKKNKNI